MLPAIRISILASGLLLAACATVPPPAPPRLESLLHDEWFGPRPAEVDAGAVFALTDAMRRYVREDMASLIRRKGPVQGLLDALYDVGRLRLEYDAERTRTAADAFAARQGNCLALVIMTGAFARELGIEVTYQKVVGVSEWRKVNDLYVNAGHINLRLEPPNHDVGRVVRTSGALTVDFVPGSDLRNQLVSPISEATVTAMFMNNRAAEVLADGKLDAAYWWAREALTQDPHFVAAYNTLAVIYQRHGRTQDAIALLNYAERAAPQDTVVLSNLVSFLRDSGRLAEAATAEARLRAIEPYPPYYYFQRGLAALQSGEYTNARDLFAKDLARQPFNAEFHFGMAATYIAEGDWPRAREHLNLARDNGATAQSRAMYSAKMESLDRQLKQLNCRQSSCDRSG